MSELKPCPFCGGEADICAVVNDFNDCYGAASCKCGARFIAGDSEAAAAAWNIRAAPSLLDALRMVRAHVEGGVSEAVGKAWINGFPDPEVADAVNAVADLRAMLDALIAEEAGK